ncbi:Protein CHROMATIN REMODELING 8 [Babesia sp. Xinjiang]|uniref:Protein CHROMATIN REMODELING 8 n=1 Tax=Babesia sp. Xinjiang TaxID=462227 RepID=UPI000A23057C|nr:Protein CHROMATIN REMODELING 8 [Babesia sp. Xinjiang]ORM40495.1 Protein CHROMATIN REMODELING 8 [Babesia sp. Xinjiang]
MCTKAYHNVEEVIRLQAISKKLKQKICNVDLPDETLKKYKCLVGKLRHIIGRIIACNLGEDEPESGDEAQFNYEFLGPSKLRVDEDVLEISEDECDEKRESNDVSDFKCVSIKERPAYQLSDSIFAQASVFDKLYIHQKQGVKWLAGLHHRRHGGILADEMGLGKTITVLSFLSALIFSEDSKKIDLGGGLEVLIVCPITLISQWIDEMGIWAPSFKPVVFHGSLGTYNKRSMLTKKKSARNTCLITSYETLRAHVDHINEHRWSYVILDEGQKIRNPDAAVTLAVKTLGTPHRLLLSGSPIQNNLIEFWSLLDFVAPGHLGTLPLFIEQFVSPIMRTNSTCNDSAAYNCALRLRALVQPFIRRHVKSEFANALKLPKKTEHVIMCSLTPVQYEVYLALLKTVPEIVSMDDFSIRSTSKHIVNNVGKKLKPHGFLLLLTLLRKTCNHPDLVLKERPNDFGSIDRSAKLMVALDIISNWEASGHKILVFTQTIQMLDIIYNSIAQHYDPCRIARVDGEVPIKKRSAIVESFEKHDDVFIFLLTTRVGGVGLNLTCADRVLIFDPDWNPMTDSQARERSYRIGQSRDVVIYRLVCAHTVEEKIYHRQIFKFYLSERILSDPSVMGFRFLPAADLLTVPPKPFVREDISGYLNNFKNQLNSIDLEMDIRRLNNSRDIYQRPGDLLKCGADENPILQSIFAHHGIEGVIKHDDVEKTVHPKGYAGSSLIADEAVRLLRKSLKERSAYDISVPTWTGENGRAAAPVNCKTRKLTNTTNKTGKSLFCNFTKNSNDQGLHLTKELDATSMAKMIFNYFISAPKRKAPTGEVCCMANAM